MTFFPGIIGFTPPLLFIFLAIISDPASPKPKAKRAPIFIIVYSKIAVSYYFAFFFCNNYLWFNFFFNSSSATVSSSAILAASKGLSAIRFTLLNILSIGVVTNSFESLIKSIADTVNKNIRKVVLTKLKIAFKSTSYLIFTIANPAT